MSEDYEFFNIGDYDVSMGYLLHGNSKSCNYNVSMYDLDVPCIGANVS
jgi:hypothetical protein